MNSMANRNECPMACCHSRPCNRLTVPTNMLGFYAVHGCLLCVALVMPINNNQCATLVA